MGREKEKRKKKEEKKKRKEEAKEGRKTGKRQEQDQEQEKEEKQVCGAKSRAHTRLVQFRVSNEAKGRVPGPGAWHHVSSAGYAHTCKCKCNGNCYCNCYCKLQLQPRYERAPQRCSAMQRDAATTATRGTSFMTLK